MKKMLIGIVCVLALAGLLTLYLLVMGEGKAAFYLAGFTILLTGLVFMLWDRNRLDSDRVPPMEALKKMWAGEEKGPRPSPPPAPTGLQLLPRAEAEAPAPPAEEEPPVSAQSGLPARHKQNGSWRHSMERPFSRGAGPARADAAAEPDSARGASVVMSRLTQVPDESIQLTDLEKGEIYTTLASYQDEVEGKKTNVLNVRHDTSGRTYIIRTDDDVPPEKFTVISGRLFSCDESKGTVTPAKKVGS